MYTEQESLPIKQFSEMYAEHPNTVVLLDRVMKCVWSNNEKVLRSGVSLVSLVRDPLVYPLKGFTQVRVLINGEFACARLTPVRNEHGDPCLYICEIVDSVAALELAVQTDAAAKILPLYNSVEYNMAEVWRCSSELQQECLDSKDFTRLEKLCAIQRSLSNIGSVAKNAFEYVDMLFSKRESARIDAGALLTKLVERCNAGLAKCGRRVEVICDPEELEITADGRHAVTALVNAVQNALLYSPRDCVPVATVYRAAEGNREFVVFSVTNDNVMFTDKDFSENLSVNFSYQRMGFGIPIIKRFAEESGGQFLMTDNSGKVTVKVTLPAAAKDSGSGVRLGKPIFPSYDTGIPDILDIKMREVAEFFGE